MPHIKSRRTPFLPNLCTLCCLLSAKEALGCGHMICNKCVMEHFDDQSTEHVCPLCASASKSFNATPTEWYQIQCSNHKFVILIFVNNLAEFCELYLENFKQIVRHVRIIGGELLCITEMPKDDTVNIAIRAYDVNFVIFNDHNRHISQMLQLRKKKTKITSLLSSLSLNNDIATIQDEHPNVMIVNRSKREVLCKWTEGKISPQALLKLVQFYFSYPTIEESVIAFFTLNYDHILDGILAHRKSRVELIHFAKAHGMQRYVQFLVDIRDYKKILGYNQKNLRRSRSSVDDIACMIYLAYMNCKNNKGILKALPEYMTEPLAQMFIISDDGKKCQLKTDSKRYEIMTRDGENIYSMVEEYLREIIIDLVKKFISIDEFTEIAPHVFANMPNE
jgi:hypothetical protein